MGNSVDEVRKAGESGRETDGWPIERYDEYFGVVEECTS